MTVPYTGSTAASVVRRPPHQKRRAHRRTAILADGAPPRTGRHRRRYLCRSPASGTPAFGSTPRRAAFCATPGSTRPTSRRGSRSPTTAGWTGTRSATCDYLYVSHLHKDHFDPQNLRAHVNKDAVVLLPDFPVPDLRRELEKLGFHRFFETTDSVKHRVSGPKGDLDVMVIALRAPADGPIGDSALVGRRRRDHGVQHERRPPGRSGRAGMPNSATIDVHMLQYSGRDLVPDGLRHARPRQGGVRHPEASAPDGPRRQYIAQVGATWVIPSAGPPCFLDPDLRTSTTTTAIRPTSSPTRWCSWTRCVATATTAGC